MLLAFATLASAAGVATPAVANQSVVPGTFPLANQPRVMDGRIYSLDTRGNSVVVGGTFTRIRPGASGSAEINQARLFKFDVSTGQIDLTFRPTINGEVEGVRYSPDGTSLFVAGSFTSINGTTRNRVAKLNAVTGAVDPTFNPNVNNTVKDLDLSNGRVVIGGKFRFVGNQTRERLAMLDPTTGAALASFDLAITDSRYEYGPYVQELEVSDDGRWLVVGGNFITVGGQTREQIAVIDLSGATATVANWATDRYRPDCASVYRDTYIRGIDISPDNTYFAVNTTGAFFGNQSMCDTAARWELPPALTGSQLQPTWTAHTGGDTHWAVHITDAAVIAGGHQRWENNPNPSPGGDNDGPGSLVRMGIAALDPWTGVPLSWNPGRDRGRGVEAMASTPSHLFVGSDTVLFNNQIRQRLAVLSTSGGTLNPPPERLELPVDLRLAVNGRLYQTTFNGTAFTPLTQVSGAPIDANNWNDVRDGYVQRGQLTYFGPSSAFFRRSMAGNSYGTPTNLSTSVGYVDNDRDLTPYDQPYGVAETVAATFHQGRIYYTKSNDTRLWWRWYSIESGVVGAQEYLSSGANWSPSRAFDVAGDWLYVVWNDNTLRRAYIRAGGAVDFSTLTVVDNGVASGIPWATVTAMFSTQAPGGPIVIPPPGALNCTNPAQPWKAEYYANRTLEGGPVTQRCEADSINYNYGTGAPAGTGLGNDNFSIRWTRTLNLASPRALRITGGSDDGIRIRVDGNLVIDDWFDRGYAQRTVDTATLPAGDHQIVVEFYENGGDARVLATIQQL
ncbi:MAG: hypothetical protein H0U21_00695 [Acidimicrobiia bacterium]|nr:hypothetical protein [Acidimicrobiia bacterium]